MTLVTSKPKYSAIFQCINPECKCEYELQEMVYLCKKCGDLLQVKHDINELQKVIKKNLPKGFEETMQYGMLTYVVPHKLYPSGYHCKPTDALPFLSIASQKNFIAVYHMGIYADKKLHDWFVAEFAKRSTTKLDM